MFADLVTVAAFLLIVGIVYAFGEALFHGRRPREYERASKAFRNSGAMPADPPPASGFTSRLQAVFARAVPQLGTEIEGIARDLKRAGFYEPSALNSYLANRNVLLLMVLAATCAFAYVVRERPALLQTTVITGLVVMVCAYGIPRVVLRSQANSRVRRIQRGLPDALDIVTMCMTGGLPLQKALSQVVEDLSGQYPDVATEFNIMRQQADAVSMTHALREFANRIDAPDVRSLSALIAQTEKLGTNVATALLDYSDSTRRGMRQRAEERASTASVKLLFPVVLCLAPPVYILMCGPAVVQLRNFITKENRPGGLLTGTGAAITARSPVDVGTPPQAAPTQISTLAAP
jgi:tight adherence protein C